MSEILITSSVLILAVILLRLFFRNKVSRRLIYGAWLLVALRLLIPVQIGNLNFSILAQVQPVTDAIVNIAQKPVAGPSREEAYDNTLQDYLSQGQTVFIPEVQQQVETQLQSGKPQHEVYEELLNTGKPEEILLPEVNQQIETEVSKALAPTFGQIAAMIWIVGMIAMAAWFTAVNLSFRRKLRSGATNLEVADCKTPVKVSPHIASPCLFGLLRPTVYLTPKCVGNDQTRHHVLTHELTHLRSGDHIWCWVRCICLCIYWFNPLVWIAATLSKRDCELACDEKALKTLGEDQRLAYGKTLLDMVSSLPAPGQLLETATAMHETKKQLKERMRCIVKKPKVFLTAAIVLLLVLTIVTGCTFSGLTNDAAPSLVGDLITTPSPLFSNNGLVRVLNNEKTGFIDKTGNYVTELQGYDEVGLYAPNGLAAAKVGSKWGFIDQSGQLVIEPQFDFTYGFDDSGLAAVSKKDKWGYIDSSGNYIVEPQFVGVTNNFINGLAFVSQNGRHGCVDITGKLVIEPRFESFFSFGSNGWAAVKLGGLYGYIDKTGEFVIEPQFEKAFNFASNGLACVKVDGKYHYIDETGSFAFDAVFTYAESFSDSGYAIVSNLDDEGYIFIDHTGKRVSDDVYLLVYGFNSSGISAVLLKDGKRSYIDPSGKLVFEAKFDYAHSFTDSGLARVTVDGKCGYIDMAGNYVIQPELEYDHCGDFTEIDLAPVKVNGKYGYIDRTGKLVIEPQFSYAGIFYSDGYAVVRIDKKMNGIIDQTGKLVVPCAYEHILTEFLPG